MNKKAAVVSFYDKSDIRVDFAGDALAELGYNVSYVYSDFNHFSKSLYPNPNRDDCILVKTNQYQKNLSVKRLLSHMQFAKDAFKELEKIQPDLVYVVIPANSLAKEAIRYKEKHPETKMVFYLGDLWPESFPSGKAKQILAIPFKVWGNVRDLYFKKADLRFTECNLYRKRIPETLEGAETLYLCKKQDSIIEPELVEHEGISLGYLGSINNIIDIEQIAQLVKELAKSTKVTIHIVGDGARRDEFIAALKQAGSEVNYYGKVYDDTRKKEIFEQCDYGLNIMRNVVVVGLTMKSLDYFALGLPIINTIEGDTTELIDQYHAGVNLNRENIVETVEKVKAINKDQNLEMRRNVLKMFEENFTVDHYKNVLKENIKKID